MTVAEQKSGAILDELRIRLEGALETVEAGATRYQGLQRVLNQRRWRRTLREHPWLVDELLSAEASLRDARARAERLAQSDEANGELGRILAKLSQARSSLHQTALKRLRQSEAVPLEDALRLLAAKVLSELPGSLRPGEKRLLEGGAGQKGWVGALGLLWIAGMGIGPLVELARGNDSGLVALIGIAVFAAIFWMPFWVSYWLSGSYTLTNQRLIWTPRRGEPIQVELSALKPGALKISPVLGWIEVDALEPFTLRGIENARTLAAHAEVLRWMSQSPLPPAPLTEVAIFPATEGEEVPFGDEHTLDVVVVMRPRYAAYFRRSHSDRVLRAITGDSPGRVDLDAALRLLKQLGPDAFDAAIRSAATQHGALMDRPEAAVISEGPAWQHLVVRSRKHAFAAKVTWRHIDDVEPMVAKWRAR